MRFGLDGTLPWRSARTRRHNSTTTNLLGKMLRLNADGTIPATNPFFNQATGVNRAIWALGLRNPFTFSINAASGRMF
jgi:glucose/arabinose dehydrogenase